MTSNLVFRISPASGVPIYRQIMDQVERMVAMGTLKPGDMLPSVRQLAAQLEVNPMTISKAYMLLESQGALERQRGQGMVVAERQAVKLSATEKLAQLQPAAEQLVTLAHQLNLTREQVVDYVKSHFKDTDHDE